MKIKKERYESLRLELQEFVPQEFVAACWDFSCTPISGYPHLTTTTGNQVAPIYTFNNNHQGSHIADTQVSSTTPGTSLGYVYESLKGNGNVNGRHQTVRYIKVGNTYHVGSWIPASPDANAPS